MGKEGAEIDFNPFFHLLATPLNRNTKTVPWEGAISASFRGKELGVSTVDVKYIHVCPSNKQGHFLSWQLSWLPRWSRPMEVKKQPFPAWILQFTKYTNSKAPPALNFHCCDGVYILLSDIFIVSYWKTFSCHFTYSFRFRFTFTCHHQGETFVSMVQSEDGIYHQRLGYCFKDVLYL